VEKSLLWFAVVLFLAAVPASVFADGNPDPSGRIPKLQGNVSFTDGNPDPSGGIPKIVTANLN
jgi:hypothetical protein